MLNRRSLNFVSLSLAFFIFAFSALAVSAQVTVTGSTGADGPYTTLGAAFTALNAGTHTGNNIVVELSAGTTEAGSAILNSNAWATLLIRPSVDGVVVAGPSLGGRGLIELNGADNVTIDGDNPNTGGLNRNLTFQNTATNTTTYTSVIRVAVLAATQISADNILIRNSILIGSATGRNISTATSTTGSENTTFGIYAGGNGGAATPTALTSVTTNTAPTGTTINGLVVDNNSVISVARGIVFNGAASGVSTGVFVTNNSVGDQTTLVGDPPYTTPSTTVYTKGINISGTNAITITGNSVRSVISYVATAITGIELVGAIGTGTINIASNTVQGIVTNSVSGTSSVYGILVSSAGAPYSIAGNTVSNVQLVSTSFSPKPRGIEVGSSAPSGTLEKNRVSTIINRSAGTGGVYGINLTSGNNVTVQNNFVWDVNQNMTGGAAFSTTFGIIGIRVAAGTGHRFYNNSVNLSGTQLGTPASALLSAAFAILATTQTGIDVRNNIFSNTLTGGTTSLAHVSVYLPTSGTSAMNLTMNNNNYFTGPTIGTHGVAHVGTTYAAVPAGPATYAGLYGIADFDPSATTPNSNFRAYTSVLSGAGTNDNASIKSNPDFTSATDLHLIGTSLALNAGATIATVVDDIDGDARPLEGVYDIGADERLVAASPGQIQLTAATYGGNEGTSVMITATRTGGTTGAVSVSFAMADISATGGAACGGSVDYVNTGGTFNWSGGVGGSQSTLVSLCSDATSDPAETFSFTISGPTGGATLGSPTVATVTITDVPPPLSGTYTVGGGGSYSSLTNPGGIFEAINLSGTTGPVTIEITSDLIGETGAVVLNEIASGFAVLIKPSGAPRSITGSSATSIIKLNGADNVRIDGSTAATFVDSVIGGSPALRELTITNTNTGGTSAVFWIGTNATGGATNNTIRNLNMVGAGTPAAPSGQGVIAGSGTTFGGAAENGRPNSNNTIRNTTARGVQNAVFTVGDPVTLDQNWVVSENSFGSAVATEKLTFRGIAVQNAQNFTITENIISGISSSTGTSATMSGVLVGGVLNGGVIAKNEIRDIRQNNTGGWGSNGIFLNSSSAAANVVVANNFISDIASQGFNGFASSDNGYGIMIENGGGFSIYYNSVLMNANQVAVGGHSSGINVAATVPAAAIDLRNNIFVSTQTVGNLYGVIINQANAAAFSFIDYNDYWSSTVGFNIGRLNSLNQTTLAGWQGATGQDLESLSVDPLFTSATDLRTLFGTPVQDQGVAVSVLDDIDGNIRSVVGFAGGTPDMGAKERLGPTSSAASAGGRVMTASGQGIRGAAIVVTGNSLPTPIIVKTGSLGYFQVDGLQTGETYVFTVVSKRFTFSQPSRVINMTDNISDLDFVSDPLE